MMRKTMRIVDFPFSISDSVHQKSKIGTRKFPGVRGRQGQTFVETTVLLLAVASALVLFFTFVRNAISSRIKTGSDTFGHGLLHNGT